MARGWESKSIETQQEEAAQSRRQVGAPRSAGERQEETRRQTLGLARAKVVAELRRAAPGAHREMLQRALADLDEQIRVPGSG
jgi:hypothetical protein